VTAQVSLSTMWARGRYHDLYEFSCDAASWGYTAIEANAYVTSVDMLERLAAGPLPLLSLHNPIPNERSSLGIKSYDLNLASLNEDERVEAVSFVKQSILNAARLGARAVVLHMGHAPLGKAMQRQLHDMWHDDMMGTEEYRALQNQIPAIRAKTERQHLDRALQTLRDIEPLARDNGVMLGIETRHNVHELPNIDEAIVMLEETDPDVVGYWHDTGHAATHQRLGYAIHEDWLARYSDRLIGIHLHDLNQDRDHQCPGNGEIDWEMIARYLPETAIRVCELGEWNSPEGVQRTPTVLKDKDIILPAEAFSAER
jgi:sugar phosphate isomerase/epimerase